MIEAIYFPFTYIPETVLEALEVCFQPVSILVPSAKIAGPELETLAARGRVVLCGMEAADDDALQAILKDYQHWAVLQKGDGGLRAAYRQALQGRAPLYDESATSRIRADIRSGRKSEPTSEAFAGSDETGSLRARVFLSVAHQFDIQDAELNRALASFDLQEKQLFEQLHGETGLPSQDRSGSERMHDRQRLDHMITERLVAWGRLYAACQGDRPAGRLPVLVSDSRMAVEQLVQTVDEAENMLADFTLPDIDPAAARAAEWREQWSNWLENLSRPEPLPDSEAWLQAAEKSATGSQWRTSVYRVAGPGPQVLFPGLAGAGDKPGLQPMSSGDRPLHTIVCLIERSP